MRRSLRLSLLALAVALLPASASAQSRMGRPSEPRPEPRRSDRQSVQAQVGVPLAKRLLVADDPTSRLRGVERLGATGPPEPIAALVEAFEQRQYVSRDPKALLMAVRVLAGEAKRDNVRQLLVRAATETGSESPITFSPLGPVIRGTAALALARA